MWELALSIFVTNLGSDQFRQREAASAALQRLAPVAVRRLQIAEHCSDREVSTRARQILDRYYAENAAAWANSTLPSTYHRLPWMAELPAEYADGLGQFYLQRARREVGMQGPPDWQDYRLATRMLVEDLYRERMPRERIVEILDQLVNVERDWVTHHGQRFDPPLSMSVTKK